MRVGKKNQKEGKSRYLGKTFTLRHVTPQSLPRVQSDNKLGAYLPPFDHHPSLPSLFTITTTTSPPPQSTKMPPLRPLLLRQQYRAFSTTPSPHASPLFALHALSNSRETQHLNKLSRLDRTEHSPNLKLIKSSEVDIFHPSKGTRNASTSVAGFGGGDVEVELTRKLEEMNSVMEEMRSKIKELRNAVGVVLVAVGVAGGLVMGGLWQDSTAMGMGVGKKEDGEFGRKIAEKARVAMPLPASSSRSTGTQTPSQTNSPIAAVPGAEADRRMAVVTPSVAPTSRPAPAATTPSPFSRPRTISVRDSPPPPPQQQPASSPWWQNLFWKQP